MAMEMMNPPPNLDFKFDSASTSPYISAASSPQRFGSFFYSAPASPRVHNAAEDGGVVSVPFEWEEKSGIRRSKEELITSTAASSNYGDAEQDLEEIDFAFDFSGNLERFSLSADELFDGGKIKPLKPPPRFYYESSHKPTLDSPKSPKKTFRQAFSPRHRRKDSGLDPFAAALEETRKQDFEESYTRGRERSNNSSNSTQPRHKATRSLSPLRVSDLLIDSESYQETEHQNPSSVSGFSSFWHKKWKIKDLLLFRSASESHATDLKEQMRKYSLFKKSDPIDVKNSSFRSTDSSNGSVSRRRRSGPPISAHEMHYTVNRAVSQEMKKRTFLPYKQGLLGCLGFQPSLFSTDSMKF
ncbi:hypothetical protein F511_16184 [Dorcoceras hygrometricum]|uniref:Uncharacterized protein n=1 Tax=Dorcoceras hygrometricum TaxID=472368 RepID=A0A2Z7B0T8_9LAMI|nr:hypothetical protein F511_16184 [Dorcoceras hygrometricum]